MISERARRASYGCGLPEYREGCETLEDVYRGPREADIERCYCTEDLCNDARSVKTSSLAVILLTSSLVYTSWNNIL